MNKNGYGSRHEDKDKIIFSAPRIEDSVPPRPEDIILVSSEEDREFLKIPKPIRRLDD